MVVTVTINAPSEAIKGENFDVYGYVFDEEHPAPYALVHIYYNGTEIGSAITDLNGYYIDTVSIDVAGDWTLKASTDIDGYGEKTRPITIIEVPTVATQAASVGDWLNGTYEATLRGVIVDTGGENCDRRGFEWGPSSGNYTQGWDEGGSFTTGPFERTNAFSGTVYFRAYARNSAGYGYGSEYSFNPPPEVEPPTVTTQEATGIANDNGTFHATLHGTIIDTGGENCEARGFYWGPDPCPVPSIECYGHGWEEEGSFGVGSYEHLKSGLTWDTVYYRAYAYNSAGDGWGEERSFSKPAVVPDPPTNVQATDDDSDKVRITWTKSEGATGYQVYRDGAGLGWLGDVALFDDLNADAPTITPGDAHATDGDHTTHIYVYVSGHTATKGTTHTYKVKARNAAGESGYSGTDTGYRPAGTLNYQWYRSAGDSDGSYSSIPGATSSIYSDYDAPTPTITHGTAAASGIYSAHVRLTNSGASANVGDGRYYKCRLQAAGCITKYSDPDRGYRGVGSLTYQWYKSAGDSDANYSQISGATYEPYNYTGAPAPTITPGTATASDGTYTDYVRLVLSGESANDGAGRYYKCRHTATGAASGYTNADRGNRIPGPLYKQWRRSAGDSDANYSDIDGATYEPYNDTGAPANGDGRWYYCRLNATGATQQDSTHDRGYRLFVEEVTSMVGGPTGWEWELVQADVSVVPITTDGGKKWAWGVATGTIVIPVGGPLAWDWEELN